MNKRKDIIPIVKFIKEGCTHYVKINFKEGKPKWNPNGNIYPASCCSGLKNGDY